MYSEFNIISLQFVIIIIISITLVFTLLKLCVKNYNIHYKSVMESLLSLPFSICIINLSNNNIINSNEEFKKLFKIKNNKIINIRDINIFNEKFSEFLELKNICKYSTDKNHESIISTEKIIYKLRYSKVKIGYKYYMFLMIADKTNLFKYIRKLGVLANVIEDSTDGVIVSKYESDDTKDFPIIKYVNKAVTNITGYKEKEIINKPLIVLFANNVEDNVLNNLKSNIKAMKPTTIEYQYIKKNGKICWIVSEITPMYRKDIYNSLINFDYNNCLNNIDESSILDVEFYITFTQKDITDTKYTVYNMNNKDYINKLKQLYNEKNGLTNIFKDILTIAFKNNIDNNSIKDLIQTIGINTLSDRCFIYKLTQNKEQSKTILSYINSWSKNTKGNKILEKLNNKSLEDLGIYELYSSLIINKIYTVNINTDKEDIKKFLKNIGTKNTLIQPIYNNTDLVGFVGLDDSKDNIKVWSESTILLLRYCSTVLGSII